MFVIYDFIFLVFSFLYLPIFLFKGKMHRNFKLRLGILPRRLRLRNPIWIHAVSVGEAMAVRGLVAQLRQKYPLKEFVISTVTPTGNKIAEKIATDNDFVTYLPLDLGFIVRAVINRIKPMMFIIAETEIWPNLITYLFRRKIPVVVINGRISESSFRGYRSIKFLVSPILNKVSFFCMQGNSDADKLKRLGVREDKIKVTGNMKFDLEIDSLKEGPDYKLRLGLTKAEKILLAGSTHRGENEIILAAYKELLTRMPGLRLIIAPRHLERVGRIERLAFTYGFQPVCFSRINSSAIAAASRKEIFIIDSVGQLASLYAMADIIFVGGSLVEKGGHNILEPAMAGRPVLFGPHMSNFKDIAELFLNKKAALLIRNQKELEEATKDLLDNPDKAEAMVARARELILQNRGATQRSIGYIAQVSIC